MSDELKWCKSFLRVNYLMCFHHRKKIRKKNMHRRDKLAQYAFKRWGHFPMPPEWCLSKEVI